MFFDSTYILVLFGAAICFWASMNVKSTYSKYSKTTTSTGITSQQAAQAILQAAGIYDVRIERIRGDLTDHYSPGEKVLRLSDTVYGSTSVAAIGVAAHECGHAIQHNVGYIPLKLRSVSVPVANFGSMLSWPLIFIGVALGAIGLAKFGMILFLFVVFFQIVTLPVEFNASRRALNVLEKRNLLAGNELASAKKVLSAVAMTYVAVVFSSILQLLRLVLLVQGTGRRRR